MQERPQMERSPDGPPLRDETVPSDPINDGLTLARTVAAYVSIKGTTAEYKDQWYTRLDICLKTHLYDLQQYVD